MAWDDNGAAPTPAPDTNSTQAASTAYVLGQAATVTPLANGTATVGTSTRFARGDHAHPTDTSRAPLASPTFTGAPAAPTAAQGTSTTQLATMAAVKRQVLAQSGVAASVTGTTAETLLASVAFPALGINDSLVVETAWTVNNNANAKTPRVRVNTSTALGGSTFVAYAMASTVRLGDVRSIVNRGATNSQIGLGNSGGAPIGAASSAHTTGSTETNAGGYVLLSGQLATSTDTLTLEYYRVELVRG